jgi:hypothetical protein
MMRSELWVVETARKRRSMRKNAKMIGEVA